jgi:RNA polymerase sigma-70 factor (ECF subfamily)
VNGILQKAEVSVEVFVFMDKCRKEGNAQQRKIERHIEFIELSDEEINHRALSKEESPEQIIQKFEDSKVLHTAISKLPAVQRRRFLLHYDYGMTHAQIAELEGCAQQAVSLSIKNAKAKIVNILKTLEK